MKFLLWLGLLIGSVVLGVPFVTLCLMSQALREHKITNTSEDWIRENDKYTQQQLDSIDKSLGSLINLQSSSVPEAEK